MEYSLFSLYIQVLKMKEYAYGDFRGRHKLIIIQLSDPSLFTVSTISDPLFLIFQT